MYYFIYRGLFLCTYVVLLLICRIMRLQFKRSQVQNSKYYGKFKSHPPSHIPQLCRLVRALTLQYRYIRTYKSLVYLPTQQQYRILPQPWFKLTWRWLVFFGSILFHYHRCLWCSSSSMDEFLAPSTLGGVFHLPAPAFTCPGGPSHLKFFRRAKVLDLSAKVGISSSPVYYHFSQTSSDRLLNQPSGHYRQDDREDLVL